MALPILGNLNSNESTYIALSRGMTDLDKALANDTEFYFTKIIALNLPQWRSSGNPRLYINLINNGVQVNSSDPNVCIPKTIQHYTENILKQAGMSYLPEAAEIAFWKTLNKLGMTQTEIQESIKFANDVVVSNFVEAEGNNGWNEVVGMIPSKCGQLVVRMKQLTNVLSVLATNDTDQSVEQIGMYDDASSKIYTFDEEFKQVIDFNNLQYVDKLGSFDFNTILLFYKDIDGVDKLHGINFLHPYVNYGTYWQQQLLTQKTGKQSYIGYQFLFNMKTCCNVASVQHVFSNNEALMWWNGFEQTMSSLNTFLEKKLRQDYSYLDVVSM